MRTERQVAITVPPGTESGTRIRMRGQGQAARAGAPAGDLLVTQATLGTRLRVRTVDGKKVMLRIPGGTQPGRRFRIKGQGVEKNGVKGDQLVQV